MNCSVSSQSSMLILSEICSIRIHLAHTKRVATWATLRDLRRRGPVRFHTNSMGSSPRGCPRCVPLELFRHLSPIPLSTLDHLLSAVKVTHRQRDTLSAGGNTFLTSPLLFREIAAR